MIIGVEELKKYIDFKDLNDDKVKMQLESIESLIRSYTHNNFQNRNVRIICSSSNNKLNGHSSYLKVGDTIQISQSHYNDGLYVINEITDDTITLDKDLFDNEFNMVTKIEYPTAIVQGVINLMKWDVNSRDKVGIQSESISRHSVTYFNQDGSNSTVGYPTSLLGFLEPFKKARF